MIGTGKPGIPIVVNNRALSLRLTFASLMAVERATGISVMALTPSNFGFMVIGALFWAGLGNQIPGLTLDQAAEMLQEHVEAGHSFAPIVDAISEALDRSGLLQAARGNAPGPDVTLSENDGK